MEMQAQTIKMRTGIPEGGKLVTDTTRHHRTRDGATRLNVTEAHSTRHQTIRDHATVSVGSTILTHRNV